MKIINKTRGTTVAEKVILADGLFSRMKGLLGKSGLGNNEAMILNPCDSIHTFFMRFAIDVIFINRQNRVILTISCLKPWRLSPLCWGAKFAIELPCGVIKTSRTEKSDEIAVLD